MTWPRFDQERRDRIGKEIRAMLQTQERDLTTADAIADAIVCELERAVLFHAPQPGEPTDKDWPLPAEVGRTAHALLLALRQAKLLPLQHCADAQWLSLLCRDPVAFVEALERMATAPRSPRSGRPKFDEKRAAVECWVLMVLKDAGLPWRPKDAGRPWRSNPSPARVLADVIAYAFPGQEPASKDAERVALSRAIKRCGLDK